jgi:hypothetical protein
MLLCLLRGPAHTSLTAAKPLSRLAHPIRCTIDLQGRRLCQGLMLCEEVHLQLATTAAVSTQPENCRFSEVETNSGTVTD